MNRFLLLLALGIFQTTLPAQDPAVQRIKPSNSELEKLQKKEAQKHSLYATPSIFLDIPYNYELFVGIGLNYDFRIVGYSTWAQTGLSASVGQIRGSEGRYNKGPFFKIGPKFFLGSPRSCATVGLQYFQFYEKSGITFQGAVMGVGLALTGKSGFFFHPKIEYQFSPSKEKTKYPDPPLRNLVIEFGLGYAF